MIDLGSLVIEPFKSDIRKTFEFDCGQPSLNDFLCSDEVYNYQEQLLGKTFLVFCLLYNKRRFIEKRNCG